jgi:hypothetical protein
VVNQPPFWSLHIKRFKPSRRRGVCSEPLTFGGSKCGAESRKPVRLLRCGLKMSVPRNGSRREIAQQVVKHESTRTTGLYDQRDDEVSLDGERIVI